MRQDGRDKSNSFIQIEITSKSLVNYGENNSGCFISFLNPDIDLDLFTWIIKAI